VCRCCLASRDCILLFKVGFFQCWVFFSGLSFKAIHDGSIDICLNNNTPFISCGWCALIFLFLFPLSLIKSFGDRCLSCALRPNVSVRGVSAPLAGYSSLNKPTDCSPQQDVPQQHLARKNELQRNRVCFQDESFSSFSSPSLFCSPFYSVTFRVSDSFGLQGAEFTPHKQMWLTQMRNITLKWHEVLLGSKLHSHSVVSYLK